MLRLYNMEIVGDIDKCCSLVTEQSKGRMCNAIRYLEHVALNPYLLGN